MAKSKVVNSACRAPANGIRQQHGEAAERESGACCGNRAARAQARLGMAVAIWLQNGLAVSAPAALRDRAGARGALPARGRAVSGSCGKIARSRADRADVGSFASHRVPGPAGRYFEGRAGRRGNG